VPARRPRRRPRRVRAPAPRDHDAAARAHAGRVGGRRHPPAARPPLAGRVGGETRRARRQPPRPAAARARRPGLIADRRVIEGPPGFAGPTRALGGSGGHFGAPQPVDSPRAPRLAATRRPARAPSSLLAPLLGRPARLADRHVDAAGGAGVARAPADELALPPGPGGPAAVRAA